MAIVLSRRFSIILVICCCYTPSALQDLECQIFDNCTCFKDKHDIIYRCPINTPPIEIQIIPNNSMFMQCTGTCDLNSPLADILEIFDKIINIKYPTLVPFKYSISKAMFESLQSLEIRKLAYNRNLDIDFLENTPNLLKLSLVDDDLRSIDKYFKHTPKLRNLNLAWNSIKFLPDGVFENLFNLTRLNLMNNLLYRLDKNMFKGLRNLQLLNLNTNNIKQIDEDTFSELTSLLSINLSGNKIKYTYNNMFSNNNCFKNIDLSNNSSLSQADLFANLTPLHSDDILLDNLEQISENTFTDCEGLEMISLQNNQLTTVAENLFKSLKKLIILDLSKNKLSSLSEKVFDSLGNLKQLILSRNQLSNITANLFRGLVKLKVLNLRDNKISVIDLTAFRGMRSSLTYLDLSYNEWIGTYPSNGPNMTTLVHLKKVDLSYNMINELLELPENTFTDCEGLEMISLQKNQLTTVAENLFKSLKKLIILDLSKNKLSSLSEKVFDSLGNLELLILSHNQLSNITANLFRGLVKLKVLNLKDNKISVIDLTAFSGMRSSLTHLDLSYNEWNGTYLSNGNTLLRHNLFRVYPIMTTLVHLRKVNLSYNMINELLVSQFATPNNFTFEVDLRGNQIREVNFQSAEKDAEINRKSYDVQQYNGTTVLNLNFNPIACDCSNFDLVRFNEGEMKFLKKLVVIRQDYLICENQTGQPALEDLKPQQVYCPILDQCPLPCKCSYMPYNMAVVVDCSFNNLTFYPDVDLNEIEHSYHQIILNISGNQLENGPPEDLNYKNVTYLDLSRNHIFKINWIPPNVKELNLSENSITLNSHFINILETHYSLERVYLKNNNWECDCESWDFETYLMQYYNKKVNSLDFHCHSQPHLVKLIDLCEASPYLTILLPIVFTVLLFFAVAFALYHRYQTEIKIYFYANNLCLWFVTEEELDQDKIYDVFISYSHQDEELVVKHLLPELEQGDPQLKVCFHVRDWIPGKLITEQVVTSVKNSRRTLVVLSNHFVDSDWGKLEFQTAHAEGMQEGRFRVIIVIYGDLDESKLDDELKSYLKTNTYVKWEDKYFWNKLKYALPHSKNKK